MMDMDTIQILIPSLSENIRIVESFIDNVKEKYELDDDIYGNIMVAVTESVNNAILHGNNSDSRKNVSLKLSLNHSVVKFTVQDEGSGFDFQMLSDPTTSENLDKPGGRGIYLMKCLSDEVVFHNSGSMVELSFYI